MIFRVPRCAEVLAGDAGETHVVEDHRWPRTHTPDHDTLAGEVTAELGDDTDMVSGLELLCGWKQEAALGGLLGPESSATRGCDLTGTDLIAIVQ